MRLAIALGVALAALVPTRTFASGGPSPGAVNAQTVKLPPGPGSIRGLAGAGTVSGFTGQVQYAVPIELPAGIGGLAPSLALGYDGGLGNGPLGIGWSISQAEIRRSLRLGVPRYDATDELELVGLGGGGQIVMLPSGELRVEGAGNAFTGRAFAGGFELTDPDGRVYLFGLRAATRKASGTRVSTWYLESVRDVAGNTIGYGYVSHGGEVYLADILWGPMVGTTAAFRAQLIYEPRTDAVVSYRTGFRVESVRRLVRVQVRSFGAIQRIIQLSYDAQFALTRMSKIRVTSADGTAVLPETRFSYAAATGATQAEVTGLDGWALNLLGTSLFDVDGDGAMDLLRLTGSGHSWRRNLGGQFAAATELTGAAGASLAQARLVDLDGDSVAEMVLPQGSQWVVHKLDRAAGRWVALGALGGTSDLSLGGVAIADVNGDQRMDVLTPFGSQIQVRIGGAAGLGAPVTQPPIDADPTRTAIAPGDASTSFHDLNGDGLADAIHQAASGFQLYLGRGDGTFERYVDAAYPWTGTFPASQVRLGDLDRDGLLDVVLVSGGNVAMYRGKANGTFSTAAVSVPRPAGTDATVVVAIADTNGNGSEDVVWSSDAGMWILDLAGPTTAGMLIAIDNGIGQTQQFGYAASTTQMFAAETAGAAWARTMPISVPIAVTSRLAFASGEPVRSSRLDVRDAVYDDVERRFIGFEQSVVTRPDPADGAPPSATIRTVTRYAPGLGIDRVLRGQILSERIVDGTGTLFRETLHDVAAVDVAGLPAADPRLRRAIVRSTEVRHVEGQATPLVTRVELSYDGEGREIERRDRGRLDLDGDEATTRTQYTAGRSTDGVRDRICDTSVWGPGPAGAEVLVSRTQTLFGDELAIAPLCSASAGWVREVRGFLASESRWVITRQIRYAATGMPIQTIEGGVTRDLGYDAAGLHPISETVAPSAGTTLAWQMRWNDVLQVPSHVVDADGTALVAAYDGVGRVVSLAREGFAPHLRYRYHAAAPRPYIETFGYDGAIDAVPAAAEPWSPTAQWRHTVEVMTSDGEPMFRATRLDASRWLVSERQLRDAIGRTIAIAEPYELTGSLAEVVASSWPASSARTVTYDALDRPVLQTLPDGARQRHAYRAFETTRTTDGVAPVTMRLDGQGRVRRTERTVAGVVEAVEATYDAAGRIAALRLPSSAGTVVHAFAYDTLGRMTGASDPDIGARSMTYDDAGRLIAHRNGAGQTTSYAYDGAGRLTSVVADDGSAFVYHYDAPADASFGHTAGRLAWVEEPTGTTQKGYDAFGRETRVRRTVHGRVADQRTTLGASGLPLAFDDGDGFVVPMRHDAAGRAVQLGALWQLEAQDAAGRVLRERYGNGVVQGYERDALGRATRVRIATPGGAAIYDAAIGRDLFGSITRVTDHDGVGLDHSAAFTYDGAARLVNAHIGSGPAAYHFTYRYDGLQNMTQRSVAGPASLRIFAGQYRYGETAPSGAPRGPRQLTSIAPPTGRPPTTFDYDAAGRQVRQGALTLAFNDFDQLIAVHGVPLASGGTGTVTYAYGHDGLRVSTIAPGGGETIRFTPSITEQADGTRQIDVRLGDRLIARVTRTEPAEIAALPPRAGVSLALAAGILVLLLTAGPRSRTRSRRGWLAAALLASCGVDATRTSVASLRTTTRVAYYHATVAAGPSLITRDDGTILDERRSEPFGVAIDGSYELDPHNTLNKETDVATGWSDHGARWLAPETARWLTPDPPVKAPDPRFLLEPWALHPYQYVHQNPVAYWDPDGKQPAPTETADMLIKSSIGLGRIIQGHGITVTGSEADIDAWNMMLGDAYARSATARQLLSDIGNDADKAHAITVNAGRSQAKVMFDRFATNDVDLDDLDHLPAAPGPFHPKELTQGVVIVHFLAERRSAILSANPADFGPAHAAGIVEHNKVRAELGQPALPGAVTAPTFGGSVLMMNYSDGSKQTIEFNANADIIKDTKP